MFLCTRKEWGASPFGPAGKEGDIWGEREILKLHGAREVKGKRENTNTSVSGGRF